jgi:hypothetical protein
MSNPSALASSARARRRTCGRLTPRRRVETVQETETDQRHEQVAPHFVLPLGRPGDDLQGVDEVGHDVRRRGEAVLDQLGDAVRELGVIVELDLPFGDDERERLVEGQGPLARAVGFAAPGGACGRPAGVVLGG